MPSTLFRKLSQSILDLLLPPSCLHCGAVNGKWLCENCFNEIAFITSDVCAYCGTPINKNLSSCEQCRKNPLHYINGIRVASFFEDNPIRSVILSFKYRDQKIAALILGDILANTFYKYQIKADVIVPVPLHWTRYKDRGYNQSELLANRLGQLLNLPVNSTSLQRTRETKSQTTLGAAERQLNVKDAFVCQDRALENTNVLLIDDVCTTGATLDASAMALKTVGAASVWGLTLAKAH